MISLRSLKKSLRSRSRMRKPMRTRRSRTRKKME